MAFPLALRRFGPLVVLAALAACAGAKVPIVHGLAERDANEIIVVLEQFQIAAEKVEGKSEEDVVWDIRVAAGDLSMARRILVAEGLPRSLDHGYGEAAASTGMIPSASDEQMKKLHAWQGEINRQLKDIPSVIEARVNLSIPPRDTLELEETVAPSASVVLVLRRSAGGEGGGTVDTELVKRLVANAVPSLVPERVEVVSELSRVALPTTTELTDRRKSGPVSGAASGGPTKVALFGALGLVVLLALLLVFAGKQKKDLKRRVIALQRVVQEQG